MPQTKVVPESVGVLARELSEPKAMRRGSVSERYVKCNKAGCSCAGGAEGRHGPYFSLSRVVKGRTCSRWLDAEQAKVVREQVESGQVFRRHIEQYWQACESWADAEIDKVQPASEDEAAKKRGSKTSSRKKSPSRSKR